MPKFKYSNASIWVIFKQYAKCPNFKSVTLSKVCLSHFQSYVTLLKVSVAIFATFGAKKSNVINCKRNKIRIIFGGEISNFTFGMSEKSFKNLIGLTSLSLFLQLCWCCSHCWSSCLSRLLHFPDFKNGMMHFLADFRRLSFFSSSLFLQFSSFIF